MEQISSTTAANSCKCCCELYNEEDHFCKSCGYPLRASEQEQVNFIYRRAYEKTQIKELDGKSQYASIIFYILAGLLLLSGLVFFFIHPEDDTASMVLVLSGSIAVIYLFLGMWSAKKPIAAIICGLIFFIVSFFLGVRLGGIIINFAIAGGLIIALVSALNADRKRKQHNL